jgi:hypothetical protein
MIRRTFLKIAVGALGGAAVQGFPNVRAEDATEWPDFRSVAEKMRRTGGIVVGVLPDPALEKYATPSTLRFECFRDAWGVLPNVHVVPLDRNEARSYSVLFRGHLDILVYPYGPTYPMDAASLFTGDSVLGFLKRGGAILTTGGVPFGNPVDDGGKAPSNQPGDITPNAETYLRWVAPLGYKFYQHPLTPPVLKADDAFLPSFPAHSQLPGSPIGIVVNNSSHDPVPNPSHGNVFPERYPARSVTPLLWGMDRYDQVLATNAVLVQDFEDGSRRIHFSHTGDVHPLAPGSPEFPDLLRDLFGLLSNRVVVKDVKTNYACYRDGEAVTVQAELLSFDHAEVEAEILVEIRDREKGTVVDAHHEKVRFPQNKSVFMEWKWSPASFATDDYTVSVSVLRNGRTVSRGNNGFIVWKDAIAQGSPAIGINGKYFHRSDGETFMLGTNYYESTRGEIMWFRPDVGRISSDLRQMRACGVSYIRPHYHHLKWFKDYLLFQHQKLPSYFASLETLQDPLPDEHAWRMFDVFIYLCQKLGIAYGGDLFTLVPEEMGDPRGWFPLPEAVVSAEERAVAQKFFQQINDRYGKVPCILWDLWNEPSVPLPLLKEWTDGMRAAIPKSSIPRLITVGGGPGQQLGDSVDFLGVHIGATDIKNFSNSSSKPAMAQEVYMDRPEDLASELLQADQMREGILAAVRVGMAGFAPWSWTRQMRLWQDSYAHDPAFRMESWDDRLGTQVHDDGTLKPAGRVFKDLSVVLKSISFASFDAATGKIQTARGQVTVDLKGGGDNSLFHFAGDQCFAGVALNSVAWKGTTLATGPSGAHVYIFCEGDDVLSTRKLFLKSDLPGTLRLFRSSAPATLSLVDLQPGAERRLEKLSCTTDGGALTISIAPTQEAYWIVAEW